MTCHITCTVRVGTDADQPGGSRRPVSRTVRQGIQWPGGSTASAFAQEGARIGNLNIANLRDMLEEVQRQLPPRCAVTRKCLDNLPDWFRALGNPEGIAALERRIGQTMPEALRLFYRFPATGCWMITHNDTDVLMQDSPVPERPHVVQWYYRPHLVIAESTHSQLVLAVELNADPRIEWGDDGAKCPLAIPTTYFIRWLSQIAAGIITS
jgi:hypothetical protein